MELLKCMIECPISDNKEKKNRSDTCTKFGILELDT